MGKVLLSAGELYEALVHAEKVQQGAFPLVVSSDKVIVTPKSF